MEVEKELERAPQEGRCATPVGLSHAGESPPSHTTAEEKGDGHAAVSQTVALLRRMLELSNLQIRPRELAHYWKHY